MVTIVGYDAQYKKKVICRSCSAILEYTEKEVQEARYTCMGDPSGHKYVPCPNCPGKCEARIPNTSW